MVLALADQLRQDVSLAHPNIDFYTKPTSEEARQILIDYAALVKEESPSYFCLKVLEKLNSLPANIFVIIDDCRFEGEYSFFTRLDFTTVGIYSDKLKDKPYSAESDHLARLSQISFRSKEYTPYQMATKILSYI